MGDTPGIRKVTVDRAFSVALLAIVISVISSVAGYYLAGMVTIGGITSVSLQIADPYVGCELFPEWAARAAQICRPVLIQSLLLWIAPYTKFDKPVTAGVFIDRGLSLGLALRFCTADSITRPLSVLPLLHTLVTAIWILFTYSLRDSKAVRPLADTCVHYLIASGFSFIIYVVSPWIL